MFVWLFRLYVYGDITLTEICSTIAADEKRHGSAYTKKVEKRFEIYPTEKFRLITLVSSVSVEKVESGEFGFRAIRWRKESTRVCVHIDAEDQEVWGKSQWQGICAEDYMCTLLLSSDDFRWTLPFGFWFHKFEKWLNGFPVHVGKDLVRFCVLFLLSSDCRLIIATITGWSFVSLFTRCFSTPCPVKFFLNVTYI